MSWCRRGATAFTSRRRDGNQCRASRFRDFRVERFCGVQRDEHRRGQHGGGLLPEYVWRELRPDGEHCPRKRRGSTCRHRGALQYADGNLGGTAAPVILRGGTLALAAANRISDAASLALSSGGVFSTGGFSETLGALTLGSDATIDLGAGASILHLADSSASLWSPGTLTIAGVERLRERTGRGPDLLRQQRQCAHRPAAFADSLCRSARIRSRHLRREVLGNRRTCRSHPGTGKRRSALERSWNSTPAAPPSSLRVNGR